MATPSEPKRQTDFTTLVPAFAAQLAALLLALRKRGYEPVLFEARRTPERQAWLFGVGRTHSLNRKPVTWTLRSRHLSGRAADIIEKRTLWGDRKFFVALKAEALKLGLRDCAGGVTFAKESCHVEYGG